MSVLTDQINLIVNINGNQAKNQLNDLTKKAAEMKYALKGMTEGTDEYVKESASLKQVEADMKKLRNQIGLTSFSLTELGKEKRRIEQILKGTVPGSKEFKEYEIQLQKVIARQRELKGQISGFSAAFYSVGNAVKGFGILVAAQVGFSAITSFLSGAVGESADAEKALSRLKNTLDNVGRVDAFDRLVVKAQEMATKFKFLDNDDITEVFQQLITYGKLTEKEITDLTPVIINFAAKSGISINESASLIIKAMEGNARALKEYGINIKDGKDATERFGIIMDELAPKLEGAASAFENTFAGKVAIAKQEIKNLQEEVGNNYCLL